MKENRKGAFSRLLLLLLFGCMPAFSQSEQPFDSRPLDYLYVESHQLAFPDQTFPGSSTGNSLFRTDSTLPAAMNEPASWKVLNLNPLDLGFPDKGPSEAASTTPDIQSVRPADSKKFRWWTASKESLLYTGIMHAFDITTEAGTRDTLNGPLLRDYFRSVGELRGWSDSDTFMAPYVGHPIEGSIFGYIQRQNDPRYVAVQWGDGRDYFISILRSMAFSAVWHTQWKIGPLSEASIGNVMLHASPGFITLVGTPTLGTLVMMGEDAADRYLIIGLENRTDNRAVIILARSFLNPGRSFANMMAFRVPWHRETRMSLSSDVYAMRKELLAEYKAGWGEKPFIYSRQVTDSYGMEFEHSYPRAAPIELMAAPHYESFLGGGSCVGGGGSGAARINDSWQFVAEVSGCLIMHMPASNQSADSLLYAVGPRWTPMATHKLSPYLQLLVGGRKVTHETDDLALRSTLLKEWNDGNGSLPHYPMRSDWSTENSQNGPMLAAGGGIDWVVARPFAWRVLNVEYTHTWIPNVDQISPQSSVRISTGAVLRIGTW